MSGLDKMKAQILKEAETSAQEILSKAREEAQKIMKNAQEEAEAQAQKIAAKAEKDALDHVSRAASAQDMQRKQAYLAAKQEVIREILQKAYRRILDLDDREYFEFMEKTAGEICASGEGRDPVYRKGSETDAGRVFRQSEEHRSGKRREPGDFRPALQGGRRIPSCIWRCGRKLYDKGSV